MVIGKAEFVKEMAKKAGISQEKAQTALNAMIETVKEYASKGDDIQLRNFGRFSVRERKSYTVFSPLMGKQLNVKPTKKISFKPSAELKELVNK